MLMFPGNLLWWRHCCVVVVDDDDDDDDDDVDDGDDMDDVSVSDCHSLGLIIVYCVYILLQLQFLGRQMATYITQL